MNSIIYKKQIEVRWADVDQNRHVRHSAYYDFGAHVRIKFFADMGFPTQRMQSLQIGPILFKEQCSFIKEILPEEILTINLLKGEVNENASRWILHHELYGSNDEKKAHITIQGAWIDLSKRKLSIPPVDLAKAIHRLSPGKYYSYKNEM